MISFLDRLRLASFFVSGERWKIKGRAIEDCLLSG